MSGEPRARSSPDLSSGLSGLSEGFGDALAGLRNLDLPIRSDQAEAADSSVGEVRLAASSRARSWAIAAGLFLVAAAPRLFVLFFITDVDNPGVGWYNDAFHHWQIAYFSKEIGFSEGFLRLWDLKGMEYFWGLLHPLMLAALFEITGSIDILVPRMLSLIAGSAAVPVLYFLLRRHFGAQVSLAGALFATLNPVAVFADTAGLLEPTAILLALIGLWCWPKYAGWGGFAWGLAGMVRAEYWVFGAGLVMVAAFTGVAGDRKRAFFFGWGAVSLAYMRYLTVQTGNPIYPVYWNFLGNAAGEWIVRLPLSESQMLIQWGGRIVGIMASFASVWAIAKRRKSVLVELFGFGNLAFIGLYFGFSSHLIAVIPHLMAGRLMVIPYLAMAVIVAFLVLRIPAVLGLSRRWIGVGMAWTLVLVGIGLTQLAWIPIIEYYERPKDQWEAIKIWAAEVADHYTSGSILFPGDQPLLTYSLLRYQGLSAEILTSQMYDPFYYIRDSDPFANWDENRTLFADWLDRSEIRLLVFSSEKITYREMVEREPGWFHFIGRVTDGPFLIYRVEVPESDEL